MLETAFWRMRGLAGEKARASTRRKRLGLRESPMAYRWIPLRSSCKATPRPQMTCGRGRDMRRSRLLVSAARPSNRYGLTFGRRVARQTVFDS